MKLYEVEGPGGLQVVNEGELATLKRRVGQDAIVVRREFDNGVREESEPGSQTTFPAASVQSAGESSHAVLPSNEGAPSTPPPAEDPTPVKPQSPAPPPVDEGNETPVA